MTELEPTYSNLVGPELFFGIVSPMGTNSDKLVDCLEECLRSADYMVHTIRLTELLQSFTRFSSVPQSPLDTRYRALIQAGTSFREITNRNDAMAILGITRVLSIRGSENHSPRTAFIFRSLKHEAEVDVLRTIYGNAFFLIGGYSPFVNRLDWLAEQIAQSQSIRLSDEQRRVASELLEIDQNEGKDWGQRVSKTFCLADFFVDLSKQNSEVKEGLQRC